MTRHAKSLAARGFHVFPLKINGKTPKFTGWQEQATRDQATIERLWGAQQFNIGISTSKFREYQSLVVVDVDNKNGVCGDDTLRDLECLGFDFPETMTQTTPSGGRHLIYSGSVPLKQGAGVLGPGIDIRSRGGFIVGAGSVINGVSYTIDAAPIAEAPEWLALRLGAARGIKPAGKAPLPGVDPAAAERQAIGYLSTAEPAMQGAGGDAHTYAVAARVKDFGVAEEVAAGLMAEHWNDRCAPPWSFEDLQTKVRNAYAYGTQPVGALSAGAEFGAVELDAASVHATHPVLKLNAAHAYVVAGGSDHILFETTDENGEYKLDHLLIETFHRKYAAQRIAVGKKTVPVTVAWLEDPQRRSYEGIVFAPRVTTSARFYNLWRGFAVEPLDHGITPEPRWQAALDAWREHALKNVCLGDEKLCHWLTGFFAHLVQRPGEKPLVAPVFKGGKGVGKNALVGRVARLMGGHAITVANKRYLTNHFNSHLDGCLLLTLDEAFWSGDKSMEGILKDLVTGEQHVIEYKGREPCKIRNITRVCIIGNEDWLVPASHDERRYAVFEVGEGRKQDTEFFDEMRLGMEAGGYRLLLRWLLDYDITGLNFRAAPATAGLLDQKTQSLDVLGMWWLDCLTDGRLVDVDFAADWPTGPVPTRTLRAAISAYARRKGQHKWQQSDTALSKLIMRLVGVPPPSTTRVGVETHRCFTLPTLAAARQAWDKHIGHPGQWE